MTNRKKSKPVRPIDIHVGRQLRARRVELGLSQVRLAKSLGVTFQQIQKYERGTNRIVASRLYELSKILKIPVEYFFEDPPEAERHVREEANGNGDLSPPSHKEVTDLVRAYHGIVDPGLRKKLMDLVRSVSGDTS